MNITIIGGGNMGSAIAKAILEKLQQANLTISDPNTSKLATLAEKHPQLTLTSDNLAATQSADYIIIAIKPQQIETLSAQLKSHLPQESLLISICAGTPISRLQEAFDHAPTARVMPNTPAQIGSGISGWFASPEVIPSQKTDLTQMLSTFGQEVQVASEDLIDAVTAVSGSGPAYFFYFLEHIIAGGISCGLTEEQSTKLALQTALGATLLAQSSPDSLSTLRQKVTSPGGTTEAALSHLNANNTGQHISEAVKKAHQRAKEL